MRTAMAQERQSFEALDGLFTPLMEPEASSTERALAQVESILDRYGVVCPATIDAAGCKGGMQAIYTVLRGMEDAGEVIRGAFVDSLGSSQFARRSLVERLRSPEDPDDRQPAFLVLDAQDPAQLYGSVLPWPDAAISRKLPQAKSGCLVILHQGRPALFASKRIRELFTFSDDAALITEAVSALVGHLGASLKGAGRPTGNDRFIVEKLNDEDIFRSPFEKIFRDLGFIQDTHGLRLLVQPF